VIGVAALSLILLQKRDLGPPPDVAAANVSEVRAEQGQRQGMPIELGGCCFEFVFGAPHTGGAQHLSTRFGRQAIQVNAWGGVGCVGGQVRHPRPRRNDAQPRV
jgi:hypothetical protein